VTAFLDASAMIALMTGEGDADALADRLEGKGLRLCSAISLWKTVVGMCRTSMFSVPAARTAMQSFVDLHDLRLVSVGEREFDLAAQACPDFGKGRHPATLNMGDCCAYACAKANRAKFLFKGDDFTKTDISAAG
jgi:ribonuclease VapC